MTCLEMMRRHAEEFVAAICCYAETYMPLFMLCHHLYTPPLPPTRLQPARPASHPLFIMLEAVVGQGKVVVEKEPNQSSPVSEGEGKGDRNSSVYPYIHIHAHKAPAIHIYMLPGC